MIRLAAALVIAALAYAALPMSPAGAAGDKPADAEKAHTKDKDDEAAAAVAVPLYPPPDRELTPKPTGDDQPWRAVRHLQRSQDGIAHGKPGALAAYRAELVELTNSLMRLDETYWHHPRNLEALAYFILSGGGPAIGDHVLRLLGGPGEDHADTLPVHAALAYAKANTGAAHHLMFRIDHRALPHSMRGQFALVKAMLLSSQDLERARGLLDDARGFAPGTLTDEAALRRAIRIAGQMGDLDSFQSLGSRYLRRFGESHYFGDFLRNYVYGVVRVEFEGAQQTQEQVDGILDLLTPAQQGLFLAELSRSAVVFGQSELALWASSMALSFTEMPPRLTTRFALYQAASGIVRDDPHVQIETLNNLDEAHLDEGDTRLREAALLVGEGLLRPAQPASDDFGPDVPGEPVALTQETQAGADRPSELPIINEAAAFLSRLDELLERAQ